MLARRLDFQIVNKYRLCSFEDGIISATYCPHFHKYSIELKKTIVIIICSILKPGDDNHFHLNLKPVANGFVDSAYIPSLYNLYLNP